MSYVLLLYDDNKAKNSQEKWLDNLNDEGHILLDGNNISL